MVGESGHLHLTAAVDDGGHWCLTVVMDSKQQQWQWRMTITFIGGIDGQRQGGSEMMVTNMAFNSDGDGY